MMRSPPPRRPRAGKTLFEVILVVTGVAALLGTAGTTLHAVRRVGLAARTAAESGTALARLHRAFAEDAAAADGVSVDANALTFTLPDGPAVIYAADGPALTRRLAGAQPGQGERFAVGAVGAQFTSDGGRAAIAFDRAGTPEESADGRAVRVVAFAGGSE